MVWKPTMYDVRIVKITNKLIYNIVKHIRTSKKYFLIVVHAYNDMAQRKRLWRDYKTYLVKYKAHGQSWVILIVS